MPEVTFEVEGLPPRKDGGSPMWEKQFNELSALRERAFEEMKKLPPNTLFVKNICLVIEVFMDAKNIQTPRSGDLDNFIGGICDGLMKAGRDARLHKDWYALSKEPIHPTHSIAIKDDAAVISINASKKGRESGGKDHYCVKISGDV